MKIVVLDGETLNPGDLSWHALSELGELTCFPRTARQDIVARAKDAEVVLTNKTRSMPIFLRSFLRLNISECWQRAQM